MSGQTSQDPALTYPVVPLRDVVVFPHSIIPLFVGRPPSIRAVEEAQETPQKMVFVVAQKDATADTPEPRDLFRVGVLCRVLQVLPMPDGSVKVLFEGVQRARWQSISNGHDCLHATIEVLQEKPGGEARALVRAVHASLDEYCKSNHELSQETILSIKAFREPGELADAIMAHMKGDSPRKQSILEQLDNTRRLEEVYALLEEEMALANVEKKIKNRVKLQMERNQREYYLTEQLKAINREMGREEDPAQETAALEKRIKEKNLPAEAEEKALAEVKRLRTLTPASAEYAVSRGYIDWILDLPWGSLKPVEVDLKQARHILDSQHYGLEKPKERILEYLAVQKLSHGLKGPVLCFVGPPGVGKTSLARTVALAMNREFVRLSLGGVRDEAEIRGHRRTYVGALPGKIIQSLKRASFNNPLFCLDEIDKMSSDYRGDPSAALLEVLDPEQNAEFMDHYLDLPYDLSHAFFITTANSLHGIPAPLLDRMEVIELPGYLATEKHHIAQDYLLPRQLAAHGLKPHNVHISANALADIINHYTRESGVRNLDRELAAICRKAAVRLVEQGSLDKKLNVSLQNLPGFLGSPRFRHEEKETEPKVGVCAGLAWSQSGGEILLVETSVMHGNGQVVTTGQLGDVMRESARAAFSYIRSRAGILGLDTRFYRKIDLHVHVPSGATPKDGPSAGITIATSIASALLGIPVRDEVAMTGEISLRGRVLPVGGLREKLLAAQRSGIKKVILPEDNRLDVEETPEEIRKDLQIVYVQHVDEVLPQALFADPEKIFSGSHLPLTQTLRKAASGAGV